MVLDFLSLGVVFGDPHFITFDGVSYSFNGKGEYTIMVSESKELTIQGRTEPVILTNGEFLRKPIVRMKETRNSLSRNYFYIDYYS